jgi:excinuclease ABC subunit A
MILAPVVRGKKGEHLAIYDDLRKSGYVRVK